MIYAQFYNYGLESNSLFEACGDRSVVILDARNSRETHFAIAEKECIKRGFVAWSICKGNSLLDGKSISPVFKIGNYN